MTFIVLYIQNSNSMTKLNNPLTHLEIKITFMFLFLPLYITTFFLE